MSLCRSRGVGLYRATEDHVLVYNRLHKFDQTRAGVVFCHAINGSANTLLPTHSVIDALAEAGYPCIGVDLGGTQTWGNDTAQAALQDAVNYLQGTLKAKAGGVFLYAVSMGNLAALNWAYANPGSVLGYGGTIPALDLADIHDNNRGGYTASIETAYGGLAAYQAAVATHNPTARMPFPVEGRLMRFWYSSDDPVTVPAAVENFAANTRSSTRSLGAVGHTPTTVGADVLAFFDSLGGRS